MLGSLISGAENAQGLHYRNPRLPANIKLPDNLECGAHIYIHGAVDLQATRFSVNFKNAPINANNYFHFNPRFGDENVVVRNSRENEAWGTEERDGENPFTPGQPFLLHITAALEGYEVEVNGTHFTTFNHKESMPLCDVTHLTVKGDLVVYGIHIPLGSLPIPLTLAIPGKTNPGDMFYINGEVPGGSDRFAVNLQCGTEECADIMFHLNPRFGDGVVVCNSRCCDAWDSEEREGSLPIGPGDKMALCVAASKEAFHTYINGSSFMKFNHRLNMASACTLHINGDISLRDICIDSPPSKMPPQAGEVKIHDYSESTGAVFYPAKPVTLTIPNSLDSGKAVIVSGIIDSDLSRFFINLQCGSGDDADIALHVNPRWDDDSGSVLVLNSREGGSWGEEIREENALVPGARADFYIVCKEDGLCVCLGDVAVATFPHRMNFRSVDHVVVDGCITPQRLIVAE